MDDSPDSSEMSDITPRQEGDGQDVMSEHLPMIIPPLFAIDHVDLVEPPSQLRQVIKLGQRRQQIIGVRRP